MADLLLDQITNADASRRVIFRADDRGLFSWVEEVLEHSTPDYQHHPFDWWAPALRSGKYDTVGAAWADAVGAVAWLGERRDVTPPPAQP